MLTLCSLAEWLQAVYASSFFVVMTVLKLLQALLFGSLQPRENEVREATGRGWCLESLTGLQTNVEKLMHTMFDTTLALTIFSDPINMPLLTAIVAVTVAKILHWTMTDRVEEMEQMPNPCRFFRARMVLGTGLLLAADLTIILAMFKCAQRGAAAMMLCSL